MGILSIFKGDTLRELWRFEAKVSSAIIWKLLISPGGILAGEERDLEEKTGSLFALEVATGKILWRGNRIDEQWWFNSERATDETIYIQKFRKPDMPEPKGILALDIQTGALRWEQPDVSMLFEHGGKVYAQREAMGRKEFFSLDARTGEVLEAYGSDTATVMGIQHLVADTDFHSVYSSAITPEDESFQALAGLFGDVLDAAELRGTIDWVEYGRFVVFSYHERITGNAEAMLGNMLRNELRILDREKGEIVYSDRPNRETPYPVPENFFIHRGILIYVKEKREIIGVPLE